MRFTLIDEAKIPSPALERVDIHRVQICALTIDSMDMNALGVCS